MPGPSPFNPILQEFLTSNINPKKLKSVLEKQKPTALDYVLFNLGNNIIFYIKHQHEKLINKVEGQEKKYISHVLNPINNKPIIIVSAQFPKIKMKSNGLYIYLWGVSALKGSMFKDTPDMFSLSEWVGGEPSKDLVIKLIHSIDTAIAEWSQNLKQFV
jgi:hypothetical protein